MSTPESIVHQDGEIGSIISIHGSSSAPYLFERYRISGANRDTFVAALIGRLCVLEARAALEAQRDAAP
ncbi:hypothetical protein NJI34_37880 [Pseudomonas sp. S 311-6]|nr:hypothetical protein [Pseudomonas sp. S 311-6]